MKSGIKYLYIAITLGTLVIAGGLYYVLVQQPAADFAAQNAVATITRPEAGLEFSYMEGPDAFSLFEPETVADPMNSAFILIPSEQFVALRNQEEIDTPPSISLFVYNQLNRYDRPDEVTGEDISRRDRLIRWANENDSITSISQAESITDIEVDGVSGISFNVQGAFPQTIYLISYRDFIYFFVGQYNSEGDALQEAFTDLVDSMYFI